MDEADRLYAAVELTALLRADLLTSNATTVGELKAALMESFDSLVCRPDVVSVATGDEPRAVEVRWRPPLLPGEVPIKGA